MSHQTIDQFSLLDAWQKSKLPEFVAGLEREVARPRGTSEIPNPANVSEVSCRDAVKSLLENILIGFDAGAACLIWFDQTLADDPSNWFVDAVNMLGYPEEFDQHWPGVMSTSEQMVGIVPAVARAQQVRYDADIHVTPDYHQLRGTTVSQLTIPLSVRADRLGGTRSPHEGKEAVDWCAVLAIEFDVRVEEPTVLLRRVEEQKSDLAMLLLMLTLQQAAARTSVAFRVADRLAECGRTAELYSLITSGIVGLTGDKSEVAILRDAGRLVLVGQPQNVPQGKVPKDLRIDIQTGSGYTCFVGRTRKPFYCTDVKNQTRYPAYKDVVESTRSQYTIPLIFQSDLVGVLNIGSPRLFGFPRAFRRTLDLYAAHAAGALSHDRLVGEVRSVSRRVRDNLWFFPFAARPMIHQLETEVLTDEARASLVRSLRRLEGAAQRCIRYVDDLLAPMRPSHDRVIDVAERLNRVVESFQAASVRHEVSTFYQSHLPLSETLELTIDPDQFDHLVRSVLWNAVESVADTTKPRIDVTLDRWFPGSADPAEQTVIEANVAPNERAALSHVRLSVRDNGVAQTGNKRDTLTGMLERPERTLLAGEREQIAESEGGSSVTMGLWACDRILARYDGHIEIDTPPEGGTIVSVCLPLSRR